MIIGIRAESRSPAMVNRGREMIRPPPGSGGGKGKGIPDDRTAWSFNPWLGDQTCCFPVHQDTAGPQILRRGPPAHNKRQIVLFRQINTHTIGTENKFRFLDQGLQHGSQSGDDTNVHRLPIHLPHELPQRVIDVPLSCGQTGGRVKHKQGGVRADGFMGGKNKRPDRQHQNHQTRKNGGPSTAKFPRVAGF